MCQFVTHFFTRAFKPVHLIGCPLFRKMSLMDFTMGDMLRHMPESPQNEGKFEDHFYKPNIPQK